MEKKKIIGFYDYTVILTYAGMLFAFTGILESLRQNFTGAIICLMMAGVCDMFDGAVASTKDRNCYEKHFGIEIDSMCDLISFGVLPAVFVYMISGQAPIAGFLGGAYVLCALIRLAYYNVQEYDRQQKTTGKREVFLGVPVTTIAIVLPLLYLIKDQFNLKSTISYLVLTILVAVGFVSGIEIKKPQLAGKIVMIIVGALEFFGVFLLTGVDIL